jgi:hypothetical protein
MIPGQADMTRGLVPSRKAARDKGFARFREQKPGPDRDCMVDFRGFYLIAKKGTLGGRT